jgi:hypothetical protein
VYAASAVATLGHARRARAAPAHRATSHSCGTLAETTQLRILVTANLCPTASAESMYSPYSVVLVLFMMRRISNGNPCVTYDPAAVVTRVMYNTSIVSARFSFLLFFSFFFFFSFFYVLLGRGGPGLLADFFFTFFHFFIFLLFHFYFLGDLPHFSSALPFLKKFLFFSFFLFFFFSFFLFFSFFSFSRSAVAVQDFWRLFFLLFLLFHFHFSFLLFG